MGDRKIILAFSTPICSIHKNNCSHNRSKTHLVECERERESSVKHTEKEFLGSLKNTKPYTDSTHRSKLLIQKTKYELKKMIF